MSSLQHLRWNQFPIVHSVVASQRFSQHMLIKVCVHTEPHTTRAALNERSTFLTPLLHH